MATKKVIGKISMGLMEMHKQLSERDKQLRSDITEYAERRKKELEMEVREKFKSRIKQISADGERIWNQTISELPEAEKEDKEKLTIDIRTGELFVQESETLSEMIKEALESIAETSNGPIH